MRIQRDQIYVAIESFAGDGVAVAKGLRLRGDNPLVARCPWAFLEDGASEEAAIAKRQENNRAAEARSSALAQSLPVAAQPRPIQDENKMICIRQVARSAARNQSAPTASRWVPWSVKS